MLEHLLLNRCTCPVIHGHYTTHITDPLHGTTQIVEMPIVQQVLVTLNKLYHDTFVDILNHCVCPLDIGD